MGRKRKWTAAACQEAAQAVNPNLSLIYESFRNSREKCLWIEKGYGEFSCVPQLFIRKKQKGHPLASRKKISESKTKSYHDVQRALQKKFPHFTIIAHTYKGSRSSCVIYDHEEKCSFHGIPSSLLCRKSSGNPVTAIRRKRMRMRASPEKVEFLAREKNPNLFLVYSTYVSSSVKCMWGEKNVGYFWARPNDLLHGKQIGHPSLHDLRCAKSSNNTIILHNWEDGSEVVCQGGYELEVTHFLNEKRIRYLSKPKAFGMPDGRTYRPDFYLVETGIYVEVKGYFRGDAKEKWDWFHENYPNSELWNEPKLNSMGIKVRKLFKTRRRLRISPYHSIATA